jgi:hypothetical protein
MDPPVQLRIPMTTLALTQIPSNINTLEKLHAWSTLALRAANGPKTIIEAEGFLPERVAQAPLTETPNDGLRLGTRVSIQFDPACFSDKSKKLWEFANELTVGTMPVSFTSN